VIPLVRASGSHREVGLRIGEATREAVARACAAPFDAALVQRYRDVTEEHLPWLVEELDGVAEGAGVDALAAFAASIEELDPARVEAPAPARCTDLLALGPATADGRVLVAHNNDLSAGVEADVVAIEWRVHGEPACFTLGIGPWISVGWNDAGLSVTGNELAPGDERVGIPRLLQVRDVLTRRTLEDAVEAALHPARASSYNWVLAHRDGRAVDVEGSGRDAEVLAPRDGVLAHTNHYTHERMRRLERSTRVAGSAARLRRAERLLASRGEPVTTGWLHDALCDHDGEPDSLCRHGDDEGTKTVFWCVADVTAGEIAYGSGPPCSSPPQTYGFAA
jgi:isopenicillin-N N-acyltransferase-like protein